MLRTLLISLLLLAQAPAVPAPPVLSEVESLRVQNASLQRVIVQRAVDDWQKQVTALKADLEKAHPGWLWNPDTGVWTEKPPSK